MKDKVLKVFLLIVLVFTIAATIIPRPLNDLDEIWNYNFARCIANGLVPYKDFNMVQTPLLPMICGTILKITTNELIIMRILAVLLLTGLFIVIYNVFKALDISKSIRYMFVIFCFALLNQFFCIDYNYCVLIVALMAMCHDLKVSKKEILDVNFKTDFLIGVLVGTSILFKQTTGIAIILVFLFYKLLMVSNKIEFKKFLKIIILRFLGVIIPIILFYIYLVKNNVVYDFYDYTILSIKTFTNKISYSLLLNGGYGFLYQILSMVVPITILLMYYFGVVKKHSSDVNKKFFVLFSYSVATFVCVYPISDSIHFTIGAIPSIIGLFYLVYIIVSKEIKDENKTFYKKYFNIGTVAIATIASIYAVICFVSYLKGFGQYTNLNHFKYIPCSDNSINKIDDYIEKKTNEGNNVYILDATASIYMIPLNRYNKDYDMLLKGNIGAKGENGLIEKIKTSSDNTLFLVLKSIYRRNWQTPEKVISYVVNNYNKIDEINQFDVYQNTGDKNE